MGNEGTAARAWRTRWGLVARVLFGVLGLAVVAWLVREVGTDALLHVLVPALPWVPLAASFEVARVALDALSSRYTLGRKGAQVPAWPLLGSHLVAFSVMGVAPAGRATAEAVKAGLLSRWIGGGSAVAMGTANQANTLLSSGTFTLLSAAAAYAVTGLSILTWALLAHSVLMNASGLAIRAAARYERLGRWLGRRFRRVERHVAAFHATSRETRLFPPKPVVAMMIGRGFQAAHFAVLAAAVGISPSVADALALHGVYLVVAALGVMVPGQIGASEGGFALAADTLGTTVPRAMSIALLAHTIQLLLVGVGFVVLLLWRSPEPALAVKPTMLPERPRGAAPD